ncbi:hypothetical protein NM208_g2232 [Fusarium decemcellulare]|uniref:Uncharacterized protein n=2 Tax=Fusarium decemcellulare TaxID=57161 RepID=A0ACC1STP3_9HYPO|nr:hypothetical protein NM208_g3807 [Fusarium decemcellulare]KAJ3545984.1 hypothetical protein NM208_g2232 [Fusarium decemcellulare]
MAVNLPDSGSDAAESDREDEPQVVQDLALVPNDGFLAWLQVAGSFMLYFNTWGIINSFGAYQTYYMSDLLDRSSASSISWIGSVQSFLVMFVSVVAGSLFDAGYFRALITIGSTLVVIGYMLLSLCAENTYWQVMLTQGVCISIGSGIIFVPSVAVLTQYFDTRLSFAVGIAASGSSVGGVVYPIMFRNLVYRLGFGWTTRITGFVALVGLLFANVALRLRQRPNNDKRRVLIDWEAFHDAPFTITCLSVFVAFTGLYTPFYYIQSFALNRGLAGGDLALNLLAILNAGSVFGRILPNFLADKFGPFNIMTPCAALTGILIFCLLGVHDGAGLIIYCVLFGFFSGTFVSLLPPLLVSISPDRDRIATRMGMSFTISAIGLLIGSPIAGAILEEGSYKHVWLYSGVLVFTGSMGILLARFLFTNWQCSVRA